MYSLLLLPLKTTTYIKALSAKLDVLVYIHPPYTVGMR